MSVVSNMRKATWRTAPLLRCASHRRIRFVWGPNRSSAHCCLPCRRVQHNDNLHAAWGHLRSAKAYLETLACNLLLERLLRQIPTARLIECAGFMIRVGPNNVITNDPAVLRKMMAVRSAYTRGHCRILSHSANIRYDLRQDSLKCNEV